MAAYEDPGAGYYDADMPSGSATGPFKRWNAKAIASRSTPRPEREAKPGGGFSGQSPLSVLPPQGG